MTDDSKPAPSEVPRPRADKPEAAKPVSPGKPKKVEEIGGPPGPEPTRYGDWQFNGKVTDF
jgi:hypothetical protein